MGPDVSTSENSSLPVAVPEAPKDTRLLLDGHGLDPGSCDGGAQVGERFDGHGPTDEQVPCHVHLGGRAAAQEATEIIHPEEHGPDAGRESASGDATAPMAHEGAVGGVRRMGWGAAWRWRTREERVEGA